MAEIPNIENIKSFILPNEFVMQNFDSIQENIEKYFKENGMRNVFCENKYEYAKVHKCRRYRKCLCRVFARDLLQIAHYKKIDSVHKFLERFYLKPQIYLPFPELMLWLQLEICRKNYKQAEMIFKKYIHHTTNLIDDETELVMSLDFRSKEDKQDPWKPKPEMLSLKESEFHKLIKIYIFDIVLPDRGFDEAKNILMKEMPINKVQKKEILDKLCNKYSEMIRETSLMHGTKAIEMFNKAKVKDKLLNKINELKREPVQQGQPKEAPKPLNSNLLYGSTFLRDQNREHAQSQNEREGDSNKSLFKFKSHLNTKTVVVLLALVMIYWLMKGGYKQLKRFGVIKFILRHVFGVK